jgi:hypothetical protein
MKNYKDEDKELLKLVGQPYNKENSKKMKYGGAVDSNGNIVKVVTKSENEDARKRCTCGKKQKSKIFEKAFLEITGVIMLVVLQMMALWSIDISVGAMVSDESFKTQSLFVLTNGFSTKEPLQMYHVALWMTIGLVIVFGGLLVYHVLKDLRKKVEAFDG